MQTPRNFTEFINNFIDLGQLVVPLLVAVALFVFLKGLAVFMTNAGNTAKHTEGRNLMVWGLVGLFVMVSLFGIVRFLYNDLGFDGTRAWGLPLLPE